MGHVVPEAADGGPIALVRDGDLIAIDIPGRTLALEVDEAELERRLAEWQDSSRRGAAQTAGSLTARGVLGRYVKMVSGADRGAVLD